MKNLVRKRDADAVRDLYLPIPTQIVSNEEFIPIAQTPEQRQVESRIGEIARAASRKLGVSRRQFLASSGGMAAAFLAMNAVFGCRSFDDGDHRAAFAHRESERPAAGGDGRDANARERAGAVPATPRPRPLLPRPRLSEHGGHAAPGGTAPQRRMEGIPRPAARTRDCRCRSGTWSTAALATFRKSAYRKYGRPENDSRRAAMIAGAAALSAVALGLILRNRLLAG